ncbi:Bardet-Biedl syndrome 10 protein homolog isoform X1 [Zootermopsis nevadensis]|uniref:Bardet-Biedl syndrome 10 protein n=1 Tax=Zootermopsis nevadensis TaxID=136037 RepID=A0A067RGI3_ZOONE|nr:Bardet-Biedl syndrome 10 protein homolog isoform X1 [Zootermopsis nevadensis]KDR19339.1 Bardet-Biedl syndrome 10 protein [Zootermopsis nevadensis]
MDLHTVSSAEELEQLVAIAFGPEGRAVMVQQPTGQFNITRSGYSILMSVYPEPDPKKPAQRILIDSARRVLESLGDGVKSFIIMTSSLLKYCESLDNPVRVARQVGALGMQLNVFHSQRAELPVVTDSVLKERIVCFETVVHTFFSTRFPAPVSNTLSLLLCQWILSNMGNTLELKMQSYSQHTLQNLLKDFSMLCQYKSGGSRPVSESCIQQGYRVYQPAVNLTVSGPCAIQFLMLGDSDCPDSGCFDDIDIQSEVERFLLSLERQGCEDEKILLVTSAVLSDLTLFRLRRLNIAILQGVLPEEVSYIYSALFHFQQGDLKRTIINVKPEVDCTWLEIPNIYQLFLHAPTLELRAEYACSCQSAIRLCIAAASHAVMTDFRPCVMRAGGCFERILEMHLAFKCGKSLHDPLACREANRVELLEWHKQYQVLSDKNSQSIATGSDTCRKKSGSQVKHFCEVAVNSIVCCTTDHVLCSLSEACVGLDEDVVGAIVKALLAIRRRLPHPDKMTQSSALEPVGMKLCILQHSLCTAASLLKVCGILQTRKKLPP